MSSNMKDTMIETFHKFGGLQTLMIFILLPQISVKYLKIMRDTLA